MSWKSLQKKKKINVSIPAVSSAGNSSHYSMNCCSINQSHHPTKASNGIPSSSFLCVKFDNRHSVCDENFLFQRFFLFLCFFCVLCFFLFLCFCFLFPVFALLVLWCCGLRCSMLPVAARELLCWEAARRQQGCGCATVVVEFYGACTKLLNFEFLATTAPRCKELGVR